MSEDPMSGPRGLVYGCLFGLIIWAVLIFGVCTVTQGIRPFGGAL
jgi:hypothetical protein